MNNQVLRNLVWIIWLITACGGDESRTLYLIREEVDYPWRRCIYQDLVSEYVFTIEASKPCPQLISQSI